MKETEMCVTGTEMKGFVLNRKTQMRRVMKIQTGGNNRIPIPGRKTVMNIGDGLFVKEAFLYGIEYDINDMPINTSKIRL